VPQLGMGRVLPHARRATIPSSAKREKARFPGSALLGVLENPRAMANQLHAKHPLSCVKVVNRTRHLPVRLSAVNRVRRVRADGVVVSFDEWTMEFPR
jgi:hypothetical protein